MFRKLFVVRLGIVLKKTHLTANSNNIKKLHGKITSIF